jgi:hypothetical protein
MDEGEWPGTCDRCGCALAGRTVYVLDGEPRCLRCVIRHRPLLRRSALTALVVGTLLTLINQGTDLAAGQVSAALLWKVPLTYAVPFCVACAGYPRHPVLPRRPPGR